MTKWRTVKLKNGLKKKVKVKVKPKTKTKTKTKTTSRSKGKDKWTSVDITLFERGEVRPKSWLSISKSGLIYISRAPGGRSYWVLSRIQSKEWPKFKWSERSLSFTVGSTRIVFKKEKSYSEAKAIFDFIQDRFG